MYDVIENYRLCRYNFRLYYFFRNTFSNPTFSFCENEMRARPTGCEAKKNGQLSIDRPEQQIRRRQNGRTWQKQRWRRIQQLFKK